MLLEPSLVSRPLSPAGVWEGQEETGGRGSFSLYPLPYPGEHCWGDPVFPAASWSSLVQQYTEPELLQREGGRHSLVAEWLQEGVWAGSAGSQVSEFLSRGC